MNYPDFEKFSLFKNQEPTITRFNTEMKEETPDKIRVTERWVNLYKDNLGKFISDVTYGDKNMAEENADKIGTFVCTIRITDQSIQEETAKALSIKESEHQEQLKEIREEIRKRLVEVKSLTCDEREAAMYQNFSIQCAIQLIDKYIKG